MRIVVFACLAAVAAAVQAKNVTVEGIPGAEMERRWLEFRAQTNHTERIQGAIDEVFSAGGGTVTVGEGDFYVKGLRLRSNVTLHLARNARLFASRDSSDFDILGKDAVEPVANYENRRQALATNTYRKVTKVFASGNFLAPWNDGIIRIYRAHDVAITGEEGSVIDGMNGYNPNGEEKYRGVHGISCFESTNIVFCGVHLRHTGNWAFRIQACADIVCEKSSAMAGHDGFHIRACDRVRVTDCTFWTGDDSIAGFDNHDVTVRGCDLSSACSAFRFGGRDILIEDCTAHGPCPYFFRGCLTPQARKDGAWDPCTMAGKRAMNNFFLYFVDITIPLRHRPGNIVIRNCRVSDCGKFIRYNLGGEYWQVGEPFETLTVENCAAEKLREPIQANAGKDDAGVSVLTIRDSSFSFTTPQKRLVNEAYMKKVVLDNVKFD